MTIVPRTGPLSASSALVWTSWYQRGKSSAWGVSTGALAIGRRSYRRAHDPLEAVALRLRGWPRAQASSHRRRQRLHHDAERSVQVVAPPVVGHERRRAPRAAGAV